MPSETYQVLYFNFWGRADIIRMALEVGGAQYENVFVQGNWAELKPQQKFGKIPKLVIKRADGSVKELWEASAILLYLCETLDLFPAPGDAFARAECFSMLSNLDDLTSKVAGTMDLPTAEERGEMHKKHVAETIPTYLKCHEAVVAQSGGVYYFGDKMTLADLALYGNYLEYDEIYGDQNPINATSFPSLYKLVKAMEAGKAGDYAKHRRDSGKVGWNKKEYTFGPTGK